MPRDAVVINLQDRRERLRYERTPGLLADELGADPRSNLVVGIDEIQKVPELFDDIQLLHDERPDRYEFYLTGSSAMKLRARVANLLPGRVHSNHLYPVLAPERAPSGPARVIKLPGGVPSTRRFAAKPLPDLLIWGSLPGILTESQARRTATLEAYVETYLEEEIRREALVRDVGAFSRFLELAAFESGGTVNLKGISTQSGIPLSTVRTYYQILVDTFLGYWLPPYGRSGRKRVLTTPRFVLADTGIRNAAARLPLGRSLLKTQSGVLLESWVVTELLHRASYVGRSHRVSFWRTTHGAEVDAVLETPAEDIPVEAKWTENPDRSDARHVERFLDTYPQRARRGFVVCRCPRARRLTERTTAIPYDSM